MAELQLLSDWTRQAARFGPFFAVEVRRGDANPAAESWRPVAEFVDDSEAVRAHVRLVRAKLAMANGRPMADIERRVAASVAHLGLVARLVSPLLGIAVLCGELPVFDPRTTWWQPELGGAFPLSIADGPLVPYTSTAALAAVDQLAAAFADLRVAPQILRDNISSALNGAAGTVLRTVPAVAPATRAVLSTLIGDRALARRHSCCLIYRAAPPGRGGLCGDCPLTHPPRPSR